MTSEAPEFAPLNRIVEERGEEWLAIPGVVGVAVGLLEDGSGTPCLKILVDRETEELAAQLPRTVDGHPVVLVVAGEIRPLDSR